MYGSEKGYRESTEYEGRSGLTQSHPFTLSARLSHLRIWTEGDEDEKEMERERRKDHPKLVNARAEVHDRSDALLWASVSVS